MPNVFLHAEWKKLAMANYAVDKKLLTSFIPYNTEIDTWNDTCYISLVGFMFMNTKLKGFRIPFHTDFEEVNLRFYVRHKDISGQWKRGVVFVKEIVPKPALTFVANTVYKENYETMPMKHSWNVSTDALQVEYQWKKNNWNAFQVQAANNPASLQPGSEAEFITEHFWGYTRLNENKTSEYEVWHPQWQIYPVNDYLIDVNFRNTYGNQFEFLKHETPVSVFLAEGSEIKVMGGKMLSSTHNN